MSTAMDDQVRRQLAHDAALKIIGLSDRHQITLTGVETIIAELLQRHERPSLTALAEQTELEYLTITDRKRRKR